jgi:hypothetical protein
MHDDGDLDERSIAERGCEHVMLRELLLNWVRQLPLKVSAITETSKSVKRNFLNT